MKRWIVAMMAAAVLTGTAATAAAAGEDEEASVEERLADAQRRLEDAARDVAELSGEAGGAPGLVRYFVPEPRRAMLGVNLGGAEPNGAGVRVEGVSPGGPAEAAGVKSGDVIVAIEDKPVATGRELVRAMEAVEPGEKVELGIRRDGKALELAVEARPLNRMFFAGKPAIRAMPALEGLPFHGDVHWLLDGWGDAEFVTLTPGLGRYFGAEKGVLVARAPENAALGLKDGDVIVAIGGREPQNGPHAMRILRSYQPGETVELRILRDRRSETLSAKIPERAAHDARRWAVPPRPPVPARPPAPPKPPAPPRESAAT
jgi:S1-C subfamily serine protease